MSFFLNTKYCSSLYYQIIIIITHRSRSLASVSSSLALRLRISSARPAGSLKVTSSRSRSSVATCEPSPPLVSRSEPEPGPLTPPRRASAAPRLFFRKMRRRPRRGWKRRFFGSAEIKCILLLDLRGYVLL